MQDIGKMLEHYDTTIVALGNNENRKRFHEELVCHDFNILVLIHPTAFVSPDAQLAPGCIVRTHAVVGRHAELARIIVNIAALLIALRNQRFLNDPPGCCSQKQRKG